LSAAPTLTTKVEGYAPISGRRSIENEVRAIMSPRFVRIAKRPVVHGLAGNADNTIGNS
jgi:hypothetical protein